MVGVHFEAMLVALDRGVGHARLFLAPPQSQPCEVRVGLAIERGTRSLLRFDERAVIDVDQCRFQGNLKVLRQDLRTIEAVAVVLLTRSRHDFAPDLPLISGFAPLFQ
jgi:hypothetical protein